MKIKGIIYDTGMKFAKFSTKRTISNKKLKEEFQLIKNDLNCNAIGFHGSSVDEIINVANIALRIGLDVWLFPRFINKGNRSTIDLLSRCAKKAEKLRDEYENIIFSIGDELSVNSTVIFSGRMYVDRVRRLRNYIRFKDAYIDVLGNNIPSWFLRDKSKARIIHQHLGEFLDKNELKELSPIGKEIGKYLKKKQETLDKFVLELVNISRKFFKGKITYSAGWWEEIDWKLFDIIGVGLYLGQGNWFTYDKFFKELKRYGKPVIATEFGAATFKYASMYGGGAWTIFNKFEVERDEKEQAEHIERQFKLLKKAKIEGCFLYNFTDGTRIHIKNPKNYKEDNDRGGYGIMKVLPNGCIKPKKAFYTLKKCYSNI